MILTLPTLPGFVDVSIKPESAVAVSESSFSKKLQAYDWGGKRWMITATLPVMRPEHGREWEAFFLQLNGRAGTFFFHDPLIMSPKGVAKGEPVFVSSTETSVTVGGFSNSTPGQLEKGDWLQIRDRLYRVITRASSNASGEATFEVWPSVPPSVEEGDRVEVREPKGEFRLVEMPETTWRVDGLLASVEISATSEV